jgi:hypothetical protein
MAVDSMGEPQLVFYSRTRGNLLGARMQGGTWLPAVILDGENTNGSDAGDMGMWASLTLDANDVWHVTYIDGHEERLLYRTLTPGDPDMLGPREVVDEGILVDQLEFTDGRHIIGDSAEIQVSGSGIVRIVYQDSTVGTLRLADRSAEGNWNLVTLDTTDHTGYWSRIEGNRAATFFRNMMGRRYGVRLLTLE